jgi:hypothetical protein
VSANAVTGVTTPWMLAAGGGVARLMAELAQLTGNLTLAPWYRTAAVSTDQPDAWASFGTALAANGQEVSDQSLTGITNKLWVQLSLAKSSTSSGEGFVTIRGSVVGNGVIVGTRTIELAGNTLNAAGAGVFEVGEPFPAVGLTGLMFGFVFSGIGAGSSLTGSAVARTFKGDPTEPGSSWTAPTGGTPGAAFSVAASTSVSRVNTSVMTPPSVAGYGYAQAGVSFTGANPQAVVSVVVAAIYG